MANFLGKISEKYISIYSKVDIFRGIKGYNFGKNISLEDEISIYNTICTAFYKFYYSDRFKIEKLDSKEKIRKYTEKSILPTNNNVYRLNSYIGMRDDEILSFNINCKEHFQITAKMQGVNYYRCGQIAYTLEEDFEKNLDFSFNTEFGYVLEDLSLTGNGLKLEGLLHLPALNHYGINNVISQKLRENGIVLNKFRDFGYAHGDDFYFISCIKSVEDEFSTIRKMDKFVGEIVELEIENRRKLLGFKMDYYRSKFEKYKKLLERGENSSEFVISNFISLALLLQSLEIIVGYDYRILIKNFMRLENLANYTESERKSALGEITNILLKG